jgi:hypothetical protein
MRARRLGRERHVVHARRRVALGIGHQFHQQHAVMEVVGRGHAHAGRGQPVQRIDLGALPRGLLRGAAELRALSHRAGLARVLHLAVFGVVDGLPKAAVRRLLVDLGAARDARAVVRASHHVRLRFLAAHELANDGVDEAFVHEGLEAGRGFHAVTVRFSTRSARPCPASARGWRTRCSAGFALRVPPANRASD